LLGFLWWLVAFNFEIQREIYINIAYLVSSYLHPAIPTALYANLRMLLFVESDFLSPDLGLKCSWNVATWPARFTMPIMILVTLFNVAEDINILNAYSCLIWQLCLYLHFSMFRKIDGNADAVKLLGVGLHWCPLWAHG